MREDAPGETGVEPAGEKEPLLKIKSELLGRRRQERFRSLTDIARRRHMLELFVIFSLLMVANIGAMMYFEGYALEDAAWLTLTTVTRVGFGDLSPVTAPGRIAVVLLLYGFGIFLLAQIVGEWIDQRLDRRDRMQRGIWRWHMKNHILVLNTPDTQGAVYLRLLVEQVRATPTLGDCPIQVFSPRFPDGLPADIASLDVRLRTGRPEGQCAATAGPCGGLYHPGFVRRMFSSRRTTQGLYPGRPVRSRHAGATGACPNGLTWGPGWISRQGRGLRAARKRIKVEDRGRYESRMCDGVQ